MNQPQNEDCVMSIQEVSTFIKIPVSTLYVLAQQGKLRGGKFGRQWRFLKEDILDYLHGRYNHVA